MIKAFGVESVSEVKSLVDLTNVKHKFSVNTQNQWKKLSKRSVGVVDLLVGPEYAGYPHVQHET